MESCKIAEVNKPLFYAINGVTSGYGDITIDPEPSVYYHQKSWYEKSLPDLY